MTRNLIVTVFGLLIFTLPGISQECTAYFPMEKGSVTEYEHFDKKAKLSGTSRQEVIDKQVSGGIVQLTIKSTYFDNNDEELMSSELKMECKDGVFSFDMDQYMSDEMLAGVENMEFTIEGDNLEFPSNMNVGDELKEGKISLIVEDMSMMNMTITIYNRKVVAKEEVTTKAGTFECYKISYDILTDAMINIRGSSIEWIAKDVGAVRTETYNKNGKPTGYTELVKLEK